MAAFNKFDQFVKDLIDGKHDFAVDTFKVMLTNTAPDGANNKVYADIVEIAAGNGYATGGIASVMADSVAAGVAKATATDVVWTAAGGSIGPFRYAVLYNDTQATKPLVAYWDYGQALTINDTETFTVDFDAVNGIFTVQ